MAIVSGYQKMKDYIKQSSGYKLISRWANANTLECDDGKTLQSKVGGISGISSSLTANSTTQAASTNLTNQLYQNINQINSEIASVKQSFQDGCNAIVNQLVYRGVTPSSNSPTDICVSIDQLWQNRYDEGANAGWSSGHTAGYNEGYAAGIAAAPTLTYLTNNFSEPVLIAGPNAHRITANADLTSYKYVIVCFGYLNAGMSLDPGGYAFSNCTIYAYDAIGSLGIAVLQNVKNGARIDFQHAGGTGSGNRLVWGIK